MKTRKELKEEYKQMKYQMGVFQIRNTLNGKVFVSSSLDLKAIWHQQKLQLNFGNHSNEALQKDWTALGAENFVYEILDEVKEIEGKEINYAKEVKALEEMMKDELQPFDEKGYNRRKP
ncbi:MAG: GIY-YIG nuclease family protein [Bacteroidota bacterium]